MIKDTSYQLLTGRKEGCQGAHPADPAESLMPPTWALAGVNRSRRQHGARHTHRRALHRFQLFRTKIGMSLQMVHVYSAGRDWAERHGSPPESRHSWCQPVHCSKCHPFAGPGNLLGGWQRCLRSPWRNTEEGSGNTENKHGRKAGSLLFHLQDSLELGALPLTGKGTKTRV